MFDVSVMGLRRLAMRRPRWAESFVFELLQNAFDEDGVGRVTVDVLPVPGEPSVEVVVTDDAPAGFQDLAAAWTLFGESTKHTADKRGRFSLGEKLVIACCQSASIVSTTGAVQFATGERRHLRQRRSSGTEFRGVVRARSGSRDDLRAAMLSAAARVIPPEGVELVVSGARARRPARVACFRATLMTEVTEGDAIVRRQRATDVVAYEPAPGEPAVLYELGVPVTELQGDRFSLDVRQRVPVTAERDNAPPEYLRALRVAAFNALAAGHVSTAEGAQAAWVRESLADKRAEPVAVEAAVRALFGERAVASDPSDPEANMRAVAEGYRVVHGGNLPAGAWENVRRVAGLLPPAGRVLPTPRPYQDGARPEHVVPPGEWTPAQRLVAAYARALGAHVIGVEVDVRIVREPAVFWAANYGGGRLALNASKLGDGWFEGVLRGRRVTAEVDELLVHEFAHQDCGNHLDARFHRALCKIAHRMREAPAVEALVMREFFADDR